MGVVVVRVFVGAFRLGCMQLEENTERALVPLGPSTFPPPPAPAPTHQRRKLEDQTTAILPGAAVFHQSLPGLGPERVVVSCPFDSIHILIHRFIFFYFSFFTRRVFF